MLVAMLEDGGILINNMKELGTVRLRLCLPIEKEGNGSHHFYLYMIFRC
jgi:hypothetical protein